MSAREQCLVLLAQQVLLHLAHRVARQLADDEDALGHLEVRDLALEFTCDHTGTLVDVTDSRASCQDSRVRNTFVGDRDQVP